MATPTSTFVSRAIGENHGTSSKDGSSAGKTKFTSTQVGLSPGNPDEEGRDCACRNTSHEDAARGSQDEQVYPCPGSHEHDDSDADGGSEAEQV
jgi:hypothetical protein